MSNKDGFLDALKNMVFEEEPGAAKAEHVADRVPASPTPAPMPISVSEPIMAAAVPDNDELYSKLLAKTDFDGTEVGAAIRRFLDPLANLPMDSALKFKTAVAQASAQLGLTESAILAAFDGLKLALQKEQDVFAAKEKQFIDREINGRQERISQITTQLAQLQKELSELSTDLMEAQQKAANARGQFSAALQRRANEIEQQKAQVTALLK